MIEKNIVVIHEPSESEPFIIVDKPSGLPSAPLEDGADSALTRVASLFPQVRFVVGRKSVEYGLVHRIDNDTSGLVLIASNQAFYDAVMAEQSSGGFRKWYYASVRQLPSASSILGGFPNKAPTLSDGCAVVESFFRPYGIGNSQVRPVTADSGRAALKKSGSRIYSTEISVNGDRAICSLTAGFRHQVRCHLAWCGFPIVGDPIYDPETVLGKSQETFVFRAFRLSFMGFDFRI